MKKLIGFHTMEQDVDSNCTIFGNKGCGVIGCRVGRRVKAIKEGEKLPAVGLGALKLGDFSSPTVKFEEVVGPPGFDDCQAVCHGDC